MTECIPQLAVGAVIIKDEKVLLVKRNQSPAKHQWAVPGGRVRAGERLTDAVKREIREETGIEVQVNEIVHVFELIEKKKDKSIKFHYVIIDYEAQHVSGDIKPGDDVSDARWLSKTELEHMNANATTIELLTSKFGF